MTLASPRIGNRFCALRLSPIVDSDGLVAVSLVEQTIARNIDRQMSHRSAARSVSALAAMLAHEVKNPLSGIRGAAQLLEQSVPNSERELTSLICEETDRIVALVDRMEAFADGRPIDRSPINIHQVLNHVLRISQNGFGKGVRFVETYDPSLPDVHGDRDQLIQVFLNLVKNACEGRRATASARSSCPQPIATACAWPSPASRPRSTCRWWFRSGTMAAGCPKKSAPTCLSLRHQQADRNGPGSCAWSPRSSATTAGRSSSTASPAERVSGHAARCGCRREDQLP